jgi:phosphoglycolate phosphatase
MSTALCPGQPAALLLDLDGTLVDSAPDLAAAVDATLVELGLAPAGEAQVRMWIGNGAAVLVRRALAAALGVPEATVQQSLCEAALEAFFVHYQRMCCQSSVLYPGVRRALNAFRQRGIALACVTNKPARFTNQLLAYLAIDELFGAIVSGDSLPVKKPDPAPLQMAADALGVALSACAMVGDSSTDIEAARNAGIPSIVVSYGYSRGRSAADLGADQVVDDLRQLLVQA